MAGENYVGLAFGQANKEKADIAQMQGQNAQTFDQVLRGTALGLNQQNANRSFADRALDRGIQQQQFNLVRDLQERQFVVNQAQSMAQIAALKAHQAVEAQDAAIKKQQYDELPNRRAAEMALGGLASSATTVDELQRNKAKFFASPASQYLPVEYANQAFDSQAKNIVNGEKYQQNQQLVTTRTLASQKYSALFGKDPEPGMSIGQIQMANAEEDRRLGLAGKQAESDIDTASKIKQAQEVFKLQASKLDEATKLKFNGLMDLAKEYSKSFDEENLKKGKEYANQALSMLGIGTTPETQTLPQASATVIVNPKTGERLQLINGQWQKPQ